MLLKNVSARLITINGKNAKYPILPGENPSVEVPDEVAGSDFVKALVDNGSLKVEKEAKTSEKDDAEKADLIAQLEILEVKVDKKWGLERLKKELEEASK
jgi:hypothetical protein